MATVLVITYAGRSALVSPAHTGTNPHKVTQIGLASEPFEVSPELENLPRELKRISTFGGVNVANDTIHVTIKDESADQYTLYGFGLYLEDGTLFAVYGQDTPIMEKSPVALLLLSSDMQFAAIDATQLVFGETSFLNPPATTERQGVVELATNDETVAGTDAKRAVTPAGVQAALGHALIDKADRKHRHVIPDVDGLQAALDSKFSVSGGALGNNAVVETRTGYGKAAFAVRSLDNNGIGGAFVEWNRGRTPAVQIDTPAATGAYMGLRWTRQGGRHIGAIDAYEGGSVASAPSIVMHLDGQNNAWTFGRSDITRGAGGAVYGTWNFNPNAYLALTGGVLSGGLTINASERVNGEMRANSVVSQGNVYAGGGTGLFAPDGNAYGAVWGGWLSNWLNAQFAARAPIRNGNGGYGYVVSDTGNKITLNWGGNVDMHVDTTYIGAILTHANFGNWAAPRTILDQGGVGSFCIRTSRGGYSSPNQPSDNGFAAYPGNWRVHDQCMIGGNHSLYVYLWQRVS